MRLGFLGDFLSASVLIGFLTGVGIQVFTGQSPDMLGIPKGTGNWFEQQWHTLTNLGSTSLPTLAFAVGTLVVIFGFKRFSAEGPRGDRRRGAVDHLVRGAPDVHQGAWRSSDPSRGASHRSVCRLESSWSDVPGCSAWRSPVSS